MPFIPPAKPSAPPSRSSDGGGGGGGGRLGRFRRWQEDLGDKYLGWSDDLAECVFFSQLTVPLRKWGGKPGKVTSNVGGALATSGLRAWTHPKATVSDLVGLVSGIPEGVAGIAAARGGEKGILGARLYSRDKSAGQMSWLDIGEMMAEGTTADYKNRYGDNWREEANKHPLMNLLDALSIAGVSARGAATLSAMSRLSQGGKALKLGDILRETSRPGLVSEG